jgi:hypothetical protein
MAYTVKDVIFDEFQGKAMHIPKEDRKIRLDICTACPHFKKISRQCGICGCFLDAKVIYADSECADNPPRWSKIK